MFGRTNAGGVPAFAVISAKYPAGSICTCSDGNIRFTAKATSDSALFFIPYAGTWIVTATDGDSTTSKTVEITKEGQNVSVALDYFDGTFYNAGNEYTGITGGWIQPLELYHAATTNRPNTGTVTKNSDSIKIVAGVSGGTTMCAICTDKPIDLSKVKTLNLKASTTVVGSNRLVVLKAISGSYDSVVLAAKEIENTGERTVQLDVSAINSGYLGIMVSGSNRDITMKKMWGDLV